MINYDLGMGCAMSKLGRIANDSLGDLIEIIYDILKLGGNHETDYDR